MTPRGRTVLDELEQLFFANGFVQLTLGELAARLHCSRRTLYELAPNKDELVVIVVDRVLQRVGRDALESARRQASRIDQVYVYIHTVAVGLGHASLAFSLDVERTPAVQRLFDSHSAYAVSVLEALIDRAVIEGEFQPVHAGLVAEILAAGLRCVLDPTVLEAAGLTLADGLDELARVFSHGLLAHPKGKPQILADGSTSARAHRTHHSLNSGDRA